MGNKVEAERYIELAIQNAQELLNSLAAAASRADPTGDDVREEVHRLKRVLSDRRGNLAVIYLQQDRFTDAFAVIEQLLAEDRDNFYIRGLVIKQGILGQFYLSQGEFVSAERILRSALQFVRLRDESMFDEQWNNDVSSSRSLVFVVFVRFHLLPQSYTPLQCSIIQEADAAEQMALFNLSTLFLAKKSENIEAHYLNALCRPRAMHTATVTKILIALKELFHRERRRDDMRMLERIAKLHNFELNNNSSPRRPAVDGPKRVAFVIDYSGTLFHVSCR